MYCWEVSSTLNLMLLTGLFLLSQFLRNGSLKKCFVWWNEYVVGTLLLFGLKFLHFKVNSGVGSTPGEKYPLELVNCKLSGRLPLCTDSQYQVPTYAHPRTVNAPLLFFFVIFPFYYRFCPPFFGKFFLFIFFAFFL